MSIRFPTLLPQFEEVFAPLQGKRVGFVEPDGNVGDDLIVAATVQLFKQFGICWTKFDLDGKRADVDIIAFGGGGNMGDVYRKNYQLRTRCLEAGLPVVILPQSYLTPEPRPFAAMYVRERYSLALEPRGTLAPDLALGFTPRHYPAARFPTGIFLRYDLERSHPPPWYAYDPVKLCRTPGEYLRLAASYEHLITNRLHFAIAGLLAGRRVTLLPNSYHKNRGVFEAWLADLGCEWSDDLESILAQTRNHRASLWSRVQQQVALAALRFRARRSRRRVA